MRLFTNCVRIMLFIEVWSKLGVTHGGGNNLAQEIHCLTSRDTGSPGVRTLRKGCRCCIQEGRGRGCSITTFAKG